MIMFRPLFQLAIAASIATTALLGCDSGTQGVTTAPAEGTADTTKPSAAVTMGDDPKERPDPAQTTTEDPSQKPAGDTAAPGATAPKDGEEVAVLDTNQGKIILKFFPKQAPGHVANFIKLSKKGFYDGTKFHRVIPGFMIQGGDPNTKTGKGTPGTGGPGYSIKAEFNEIKHNRGILSMARSQDPDSGGSQFFIMVAPNSGLDGQYSAFGQVVSGMDAVDKIVNLPRNDRDMPTGPEGVIKSVKIEKWPVK
jgi:peptidyl-prolyl cis-trans isomerase B (cyclophilin B)